MIFKIGAKILAYHGPLIYEGRVLKVHEKGKNFVESGEGHEPIDESLPKNLVDMDCCFLHYKGWKLKWDEWVTLDRMMEYNNENWELSKTLRASYNQKMRNKVPTEKPKPVNPPTTNNDPKVDNGYNSVIKGIKRKLGDDKPKKGKDIVIPISNELKSLLVDDWEFITKDHKVLSLPVKKPIKSIFEDYLEFEKCQKADMVPIKEFIHGLKVYFDQTLKLFLLYKYERLQYSYLLKENNNVLESCEVYGIEHLLRLIITLPGLISNTSMDLISINVLIEHCDNFLKFLSISFTDYLNDYENTLPAYDNLARS